MANKATYRCLSMYEHNRVCEQVLWGPINVDWSAQVLVKAPSRSGSGQSDNKDNEIVALLEMRISKLAQVAHSLIYFVLSIYIEPAIKNLIYHLLNYALRR